MTTISAKLNARLARNNNPNTKLTNISRYKRFGAKMHVEVGDKFVLYFGGGKIVIETVSEIWSVSSLYKDTVYIIFEEVDYKGDYVYIDAGNSLLIHHLVRDGKIYDYKKGQEIPKSEYKYFNPIVQAIL